MFTLLSKSFECALQWLRNNAVETSDSSFKCFYFKGSECPGKNRRIHAKLFFRSLNTISGPSSWRPVSKVRFFYFFVSFPVHNEGWGQIDSVGRDSGLYIHKLFWPGSSKLQLYRVNSQVHLEVILPLRKAAEILGATIWNCQVFR